MAVYRLHRKEWEKSSLGAQAATLLANVVGKGKTPEPAGEDEHKSTHKGKGKDRGKKRKIPADEDEDEEDLGVGSPLAPSPKKKSKTQKEFPGGGRKGVSSGLSTIVRQKGKTEGGVEKGKGTGGALQKKSSVKDQWWKELGNSGGATGAKFSLRL
jgi:RNA exonuclease 4